MLVKLSLASPMWVTVPDVVGDAKATLTKFREWLPEIRDFYRIPRAFVAQDGIENIEIPWNNFSCLFIGGSTGFKYSYQTIKVIKEAQERGKMVHMGRVNTINRIEHAFHLGVDTFDGTSFSMYSNKIAETVLRLSDLCEKRR